MVFEGAIPLGIAPFSLRPETRRDPLSCGRSLDLRPAFSAVSAPNTEGSTAALCRFDDKFPSDGRTLILQVRVTV